MTWHIQYFLKKDDNIYYIQYFKKCSGTLNECPKVKDVDIYNSGTGDFLYGFTQLFCHRQNATQGQFN